MTGALLEMKEISIEFPGVNALNKVAFSTNAGSVHALIGANGAGKSTLMKVLAGAYNHYTGEILLGGKNVNIRSPKNAYEAGIQIVYQEVDTALISNLSVGENILLNELVNHIGKKQFVNWKEIHRKATRILDNMKVNVSSKKLVSELTLAEKQLVLIARSISTDCKFLILDEPTAPLSHNETTTLFRIIRELAENGVGIIFISHRLPEIYEICNEITIMKNGESVKHEAITSITQKEVIEHMLGRPLNEQFPEYHETIGELALSVSRLSDGEKIQNIDMYVRQGEIVGLAGLVGAGKTELCKALFGDTKLKAGKVMLKGNQVKLSSPHAAVQHGIALVPEERRKEGILVKDTVATNLSAANLSKFTGFLSFLDRNKEKHSALDLISSLGIKTPSEDTIVENLSGGNQQKIAIGKWLVADADVYLFDEPTKGVDVGAKKDIFELIVELAKRGKAIIYASSELSEIIGITTRAYVLYNGSVVKELITKNTTEEELLFYSTGGK